MTNETEKTAQTIISEAFAKARNRQRDNVERRMRGL